MYLEGIVVRYADVELEKAVLIERPLVDVISSLGMRCARLTGTRKVMCAFNAQHKARELTGGAHRGPGKDRGPMEGVGIVIDEVHASLGHRRARRVAYLLGEALLHTGTHETPSAARDAGQSSHEGRTE